MVKVITDAYHITIPDNAFHQLPVDEQIQYALEEARKIRLVPVDTDFETFRRLIHMHTTNYLAEKRYVPQIYPGQITYFRSSEGFEKLVHAPREKYARGWDELTSAGIQVHVIAGTHSSMLDIPHVASLAQTLARSLDNA